MVMLHLYFPTTPGSGERRKLEAAIEGVTYQMEGCYNVDSCDELSEVEMQQLVWILSKPFESSLSKTSTLKPKAGELLYEYGPRLNFSSPLSTNAVSICNNIGLKKISRIELSRRYLLTLPPDFEAKDDFEDTVAQCLHDHMTECLYETPINSFQLKVVTHPITMVDVMGQGMTAITTANINMGLAFDQEDEAYYNDLFVNKVQRNPTSVEIFDLAQSNSEHSRHWFFRGKLFINGAEQPHSLMNLVTNTQASSNQNNVIAFKDNSSAIRGHKTRALVPRTAGKPSALSLSEVDRDIVFTAETHNFPTGKAPFPGATTGTGGRIRDVHATGQGAHVVAGTAGYCFGNLLIPDYHLLWERRSFTYPKNFAKPLSIAIEASNGASDYGNKFGEPVITGFVRSCGIQLVGGIRREYVKPIMFSGGIGTIEHQHINKTAPEKDMLVVKLGGPAYRIGIGGGTASSMEVQGHNKEALDLNAVQRGDPEMEQKLNRVIRACVELGDKNPICSIHDQGAGGNGNVLREIMEPAGGLILADNFRLGDPTLSLMELWGAEYQESDACLVRPDCRKILEDIGTREHCPVDVVGTVTDTGKIQVQNFTKSNPDGSKEIAEPKMAVDLDIQLVSETRPSKTYRLDYTEPGLMILNFPLGLKTKDALDLVLRLPSVASKRWLTTKVDRSVTGLVAQQQCVGPLHIPLADVAVVATSHFDTVGAATAIGEQPMKGLVSSVRGARMTVAEALTNLVFAPITCLRDVKCSANWMWPAKMPGEGALLHKACTAMCEVMAELGIAVDGGKDSLSMAARVDDDTIKAPGTLVVSAYAPCTDITAVVTPDFKCPGRRGNVLWVRVGTGTNYRLGGSALAQCYAQIGDNCPDLDDPQQLVRAFQIIQNLITERVLTAGHDISDGGLITCLLEMAFAGNCGMTINLPDLPGLALQYTDLEALFSEEVGFVLETRIPDAEKVINLFTEADIPCVSIGHSHPQGQVKVSKNERILLQERMVDLRDIWEATSFRLERFQANPACVEQEEASLRSPHLPSYNIPFPSPCPRVAIIREEGSNGDREMAAAFQMVGFEAWDINMNDLITGDVTLADFRGLAFVGGFSYADVCGSAKGWAAAILYHENVKQEFANFRQRPDTFSLGVCNGCQLMALIGWVGTDSSAGEGSTQGVFLDHNLSERYESRWTTVKVQQSPAIMLADMEGTTFGIWVAHGEGRMVFKRDDLLEETVTSGLAPIRYIGEFGEPTTAYPFNPNGSPQGIAALCSPDGRHLAIMPHPERCFMMWQCPWVPQEILPLGPEGEGNKPSPWLQMFHNAYKWCCT